MSGWRQQSRVSEGFSNRGVGRGSSGSKWRGNKWRGRGNRSRGRGRGSNYNGYNNSQNSQLQSMDNHVPSQQSRPAVVHRGQTTLYDAPSPYIGWKLYFPQEVYSDLSPVVNHVQVFEKYIISWKKIFDSNAIEMNGSFTVDYKDLANDQIISKGIPDFNAEFRDSPDSILACLGLAMHQIIIHDNIQEMRSWQVESVSEASTSAQVSQPSIGQETTGTLTCDLRIIHARIINHDNIIPLKNLKANSYGKFVSVKGTVVRVSNIKPLCMKMAFECLTCATVQCMALPDGRYMLPSTCGSAECRSRNFIPKRSSPLTQTIDWQTIRVQELMSDDRKESGRIPRTVECEFTYDLVDSCVPGDVVTVSGVVKVNASEEGRGRNKDKCMFLLYIHANSVNNTKGSNSKQSSDNGTGLAVEFTMKELYAIREIHSETSLFRLLVASLCPAIYGHEMVKAGLLLGLFGGSQKFANDKNRIPVRGDPHILVVGDPGLGKSQMLQSVANIAPRSVYVCGNTTTTSGLTVTLSKDGGSGDYALEAGALVLADQGCCCIDEFDKMTSQHQALLEAMEQQSISIAKAGIVCSLPARAAIIAAANPVGGHYNKSKTVSENLKLGSALLSRFDLVFILLDKPDEEMDNVLSEHVMALHAGKKRSMNTVTVRRDETAGISLDESRLQWEADRPLSERLKVPRNTEIDVIPSQLLRKYVGYARKYVQPKIGPEAAKIIQDFYLSLRQQYQTQDSTPITTRQLESLIRLTESRARLELRELATQHDAEDVVAIMKYSMRDTYSDQFGWLDFKRSQHGSGMSGRAQPKRFVAALQRVSDQTYNSIFTVEQMRQIARDMGLQVLDFEGFISSLNNQGFLLKKGPKVYQLQTAGF